eukprot:CAMPEP_0113936988 /NCGR_PEP_ID=MMETSP1339-20121228/3709_1 /TAXON_ID=94617 /ORGANISM="Fibrocapsa japonica" /LENGTH=338 /DNA_ID=CAMNT_0000939583 /DNA_START=144 /DNA_END=1160 /DNA_ORIENTATION=- /assembly_acc=CAM_ASM_000762
MSQDSPDSGESFLVKRKDFIKTAAGGVLVAVVGKSIGDGPEYRKKPDLSDKNVVITGGNTGLGKETAIRLAGLGANVVITCRRPDTIEAAIEDIKKASKSNKVSAMTLDLASMASIASFAKEVKSALPKIDILVNNAGVMAIPERKTTAEGFEYQLGVNHLGHFYLTSLLLDKIRKAKAGARIVNVSSEAHRFVKEVNFDDLMAEKEYAPWTAYGQSKLSNILFTKELQKRLNQAGDSITCTACHPGGVRTELGRYLDIPVWAYPLLVPLVYFTKSVKMGAQTQVFLSAEQSLTPQNSGGLYYDNCKAKDPTAGAKDMEAAAKLWKVSEEYLGKKFSV